MKPDTIACRNCRFFEDLEDGGGDCRRNPPFPAGSIPDYTQWPPLTGMWPRVSTTDWCGEFRRRP